jgi:hypothetical protein
MRTCSGEGCKRKTECLCYHRMSMDYPTTDKVLLVDDPPAGECKLYESIFERPAWKGK